MRLATQLESDHLCHYLNSLHEGDFVFRQFHGAGFITDDEPSTIEKIDRFLGLCWLSGADGDYTRDSLFAYSLTTGRELNPVRGFFHQIITK